VFHLASVETVVHRASRDAVDEAKVAVVVLADGDAFHCVTGKIHIRHPDCTLLCLEAHSNHRHHLGLL
jgi:hypothetical protein